MDQQTHDAWHSQLLPDFEQTTVLNIKSRTIKIVQIVDQNISKWSLHPSYKFAVSHLFIDDVMYWVQPEICDKTRVQRSKCRNPIASLDKFRTVSRNRWNRNKPKILGNHVFAPLIFTHLYQFCLSIERSHSNLNAMYLFLNILLDILTSDVRLKQTRPQPLIPHTTLLIDNLFRGVCFALLKYHGVDGPSATKRLDSNGFYIKKPSKARQNHSQFVECIKQIKTAMTNNNWKRSPSFLLQHEQVRGSGSGSDEICGQFFYRNSDKNYSYLVNAYIRSMNLQFPVPIFVRRLCCSYHHDPKTDGLITEKSDIWNENSIHNHISKTNTNANDKMVWRFFDEDYMSDDTNSTHLLHSIAPIKTVCANAMNMSSESNDTASNSSNSSQSNASGASTLSQSSNNGNINYSSMELPSPTPILFYDNASISGNSQYFLPQQFQVASESVNFNDNRLYDEQISVNNNNNNNNNNNIGCTQMMGGTVGYSDYNKANVICNNNGYDCGSVSVINSNNNNNYVSRPISMGFNGYGGSNTNTNIAGIDRSMIGNYPLNNNNSQYDNTRIHHDPFHYNLLNHQNDSNNNNNNNALYNDFERQSSSHHQTNVVYAYNQNMNHFWQ